MQALVRYLMLLQQIQDPLLMARHHAVEEWSVM